MWGDQPKDAPHPSQYGPMRGPLLTDNDPGDPEAVEAVVYCPACAEREFGIDKYDESERP